MVHVYNGILLGHKKQWNLTICDSKDEPTVSYAKWNNQIEKDKYHMISLYLESKEQK